MKKIITLLLLLISIKSNAQEKCLSEILFQEAAKNDPSLLETRERLERYTQEWIRQNGGNANRSAGSPYVIPVVFHVIHRGGTENISDAQILNQMDLLNKDYRRLNDDTTDTPSGFLPDAGDAFIEFRLAQLDPNGNCTNGITRTYSPLTFDARNNVKGLIQWPYNMYLNVWVVQSIENTNGSAGIVIGFAQFPAGGAASTDGVVLKHDFVGEIGTAINSGGAGRTMTHEVGHWLNLRHIWGDATGCLTDDLVSDTPLQNDMTFGGCPNWPLPDACTPSGNGINFSNYMDYTDGDCQNMFTWGQVTRMQATLNNNPPASGRNNLWQSSNLTATGTDGTPAVICTPTADFLPLTKFLCEGGNTSFKDMSWRGAVTSRLWDLPGGTPAVDTSFQPTITYANPGVYDVTLTATNSGGSNSKTINEHVVVSPLAASNLNSYAEGFESGIFPIPDFFVLNYNGGNEWDITSNGAATGSNSIYLDNHSNNDKGPDEFILPSINLSNVTQAQLTFNMACTYKTNTGTNADALKIWSSIDCGKTWTLRYTVSGTNLQTTTNAVSSPFFPSSAQWEPKTVNLSTSLVSTRPNVRIRFEFTHDDANNLYIDDINISGIVDVNEAFAQKMNVNIYPNPSQEHTYLTFTTEKESMVQIEITDATGRIVNTISESMEAGEHQYQLTNSLESGVYFVRVMLDNATVTKRVVMN